MIPGESAPRIAPRQRFGATPEQIWKEMLFEASEGENKADMPQIVATDISPDAVQNAQLNAHAAGVANLITFKACDFGETPVPQGGKGVVFFNPEYGIRLGTTEELTPIYERIGMFMAEKCAGYTGGLITGNPELAKVVPLYYSHRVPFYNGPIDCRLFVYPECKIRG